MKKSYRARIILVSLPFLLFALSIFSFAPVASAYGKAQFQVAVSANCNNPSLCGGGTSGDWGWCALGGSGTWADCQITAYGKFPGTGAGPGEVHASLEFTSWTTAVCTTACPPSMPGAMTFHFQAGTATLRGGSISGQEITVDACSIGFCGDTGIPSNPGHYDIMDLTGFQAPGIHFNVQVNQIP